MQTQTPLGGVPVVEILTFQGASDELVGQVPRLRFSEIINAHGQERLAQRGSRKPGERRRRGGKESSMLYASSASPPPGPGPCPSPAERAAGTSQGPWPVTAPAVLLRGLGD